MMGSLRRLLMLFALSLSSAAVISACAADDPTPAPTGPTPTPIDAAPVDPGEPDPTPAPTEDASVDQVSFEGRTITIIVGFSPGGTHDLNSRLLAAVLPRYLPGSPRIVVQNLPGAGGARGVETAMRRAPDGLTVSHVAVRFFKRPLFGQDIPGFDPGTVPILGSPTFGGAGSGFWTRREVATSWADVEALGRPILAGSTSPGSNANTGNEFVALIGGPIEHLFGYGGSAEVLAALDRREVESSGFASRVSVLQLYPEWLPNRYVVPVFWWGDIDELDAQFIQDIGAPMPPDIREVIDATDRQWDVFDITVAMNGMSRVYVLPHDTPSDIHQVWAEAFAAVFDDQDYLDLFTAATDGDVPNLGTPEQIREIYESAKQMSPEELAFFQELAGDQ